MFQSAVISELPVEESTATMGDAFQLLLALGIAFVALLAVIWITLLLARYIRRNAARVKCSLGETKVEDLKATTSENANAEERNS